MRGQGLAGQPCVLVAEPSRRLLDGVVALSRVSPVTSFVLCADLVRSLDFYTRILGFTCTFETQGCAFVQRDVGVLRLLEVGYAINLKREQYQQSCLFDVADIDALWEQLEPRLRYLAEGRVRPPFEGAFGQREFHVGDPDALEMRFAQSAG